MGLHIYCIVPAGFAPPPSFTGVADATVSAADAGVTIGLWSSTHPARPAANAAAVLAHNRVIAAAMEQRVTPVPVRFGQWFDSLDGALERIAADEPRWAAQLTRFAGCAEYGVRVISDAVPDPARDVHPAPGVSGTEYMAALVRRHAETESRRAQGDAIVAQLDTQLGDVILDRRVEHLEGGGLVSCAYLVAQTRAADYHAVLARVRRSRSDLRFLYTGPWPPYSFTA